MSEVYDDRVKDKEYIAWEVVKKTEYECEYKEEVTDITFEEDMAKHYLKIECCEYNGWDSGYDRIALEKGYAFVKGKETVKIFIRPVTLIRKE